MALWAENAVKFEKYQSKLNPNMRHCGEVKKRKYIIHFSISSMHKPILKEECEFNTH